VGCHRGPRSHRTPRPKAELRATMAERHKASLEGDAEKIAASSCSPKLRRRAGISSRRAASGISSQPASSKNHERRSGLIESARAEEKISIGTANSPAKPLPQNRASPRCCLVKQPTISAQEERLGSCIFMQRNAPVRSCPKTKSSDSFERIGFAERRSFTCLYLSRGVLVVYALFARSNESARRQQSILLVRVCGDVPDESRMRESATAIA
jgi:hypothetical protein